MNTKDQEKKTHIEGFIFINLMKLTKIKGQFKDPKEEDIQTIVQ